LEGAKVIQAHISADNGFIHMIAKFVLPSN
jgi:uncharacterized surface protein with fasciclin (FAS1) repeats